MSEPDGPPVGFDQQRWLEIRRYLRAHRSALAIEAAWLYPDLPRVGRTSLLTRPEWIPDRPVPLERVILHRATPDRPDPGGGDAAGRRPFWREPPRYADVVAALDPPRLLENRPTYRLTGASLGAGEPTLTFAVGEYFDALNIGEAVAHEYADRHEQDLAGCLHSLPLRRLIGDPTDPGRRPMPTAVTTLTVRRDGERAAFLTHWRDPAKVATNGGFHQVIPVGMFQPARSDHAAVSRADPAGEDFDLWRCIAREYSEELLGAAEHHDVDYPTWQFFRRLEQARAAGECRAYLLGIGVDPLNLATDVLTAVVFDAPAFDRLFADMVEENEEGRTNVRDHAGRIGTPLTSDAIDKLLVDHPMQAAGAATLDLALRHRVWC